MIQTKTTLLVGVCALATVASIRFATAQATDDAMRYANSGQSVLTVSQSYRGTRPGTGNPLPRVAELQQKQGLWITWPGFMMNDNGGSRVFLQTTGPLKYKMKTQKKKIVLSFKNTQVYLYNNRNPLVTEHFNTPIARINLKRRNKRTELILSLKVDAVPSVSQLTDADGYNYFFIDFAPGNYPQGGSTSSRPLYNSKTHQDMDTPSNDYSVPEEIQ